MGLREGVKAAWGKALSPLFGEFAGEVQVEVVDASAPPLDPLYGEPSGEKQYLPPVTLKARVKLARERLVLPGGGSVDVEGRITVRTEDLADAGIEIDFSTLVTVRGERYAVAHVETAAQLGEEFLLTGIWLKER